MEEWGGVEGEWGSGGRMGGVEGRMSGGEEYDGEWEGVVRRR